MHKLIFAGSVSTQQCPTQQFGSRLSWLVKVLLAMTILMGMKTVFAYSFVCQSASMLSPFADKIVDSALQNGQVISNQTLTATLGRCTNSSTLVGDTFFTVVVPTDSVGTPLKDVPGISVASSALPYAEVTRVSGSGCSLSSTSYSGGLTSITFNHPIGATCSYSVHFPVSLTMHSGSGLIAGIVGTDLTTRSPINGGNGWALYSGSANNSFGLSSVLTLVSTTCTLSTNDVIVTLPKIGTSALGGGTGTTAGRTPFTLELAGCSDLHLTYLVKASWAFAEGAAGPTTITNSASGPASNVFVQLLDSVMAPIRNGGDSNLATVSTAGHYQVKHYAQYYAGGVVGSGLVKGVATLNLFYE
jgi:major type 1 subunit fimbrin (pilin)